MIITVTNQRSVNSLTVVDSASVELHPHESIDKALTILSRIREDWEAPKENQNESGNP